MFVLPNDKVGLEIEAILSQDIKRYYIALIACVLSCALAACMALLKAALIQWTGSDEGITAIQQAANGLALTSVTVTAGIIVSAIGKANGNGNGKSNGTKQ